jgi:hypothetical protein
MESVNVAVKRADAVKRNSSLYFAAGLRMIASDADPILCYARLAQPARFGARAWRGRGVCARRHLPP